MPKVGDKEFPYTPEGMAAAKAESQNMGIPVNNGANRSVTEYAGGGKTGYNAIGMQNPMMGHGGKMMKYEEGGLAGDENKDGKLSIAEKNKLAKAKRKARMEKGIEEGTKKRKKVKKEFEKAIGKVDEFLEDKNLKPTFEKDEKLAKKEKSAKVARAEKRAARKAARKAKREERKAFYAKERDAMKKKPSKSKSDALKDEYQKAMKKKSKIGKELYGYDDASNKETRFAKNQKARDAKKAKAELLKRSEEISKKAKAATIKKLVVPKIDKQTIGFTIGKSKPKPKPKPKAKSDFGSAFREARNAGKNTFMYNNKKYTTKLKGE